MTLEQQLVYAKLTDDKDEVRQLTELIRQWDLARQRQIKQYYKEKHGLIL